MEELTIEQKAKRYDEILARANGANLPYYKEDIMTKVREFAEYLLPELKESEDERVRKKVIDVLKLNVRGAESQMQASRGVDRTFEVHACNKAIAWLEKKDTPAKLSEEDEKKELKKIEQKPCMIQWKGDNLKEVIDFTGKDKNFDKWFNSFEEYEKFVREHDGILKLFNEDGSHYEVPVGAWIVKTPDGRNVASKAVFKQKPADKIEPKFHEGDIVKRKDNPHLTYILKRLTDDGDYEFHAIGKDGNEGCTCFAGVKYQDDWELVEQKPAWSEEDEDMINSIIRELIHQYNEEIPQGTEVKIKWLKNKLKSLKPKTTWKPSKEQIEALEGIISCVGDNQSWEISTEYLGVLLKLKEQLKKLKE